MTPAQFQQQFASRLNRIKKYAQRDLPIHIGKIAVSAYQNNFRLGGYVDKTLKPWKPAKRLSEGGTGTQYGTLMSSRQELYNATEAIPEDGKVTLRNGKKYARIHQQGGTITVPVTPKMRKYAWAMYYKNGGGKQNGGNVGANGRASRSKSPSWDLGVANKWRAIALTRRTSFTIIIPQRQFMGKGVQLRVAINSRAKQDIKRILMGQL